MIREDSPAANIHVVPWSVRPQPTKARFDQRHGMALVGNYAHAPNVDAALWLVQQVMPAVRLLDPGIECVLVGNAMPDVLRHIVGPGIRSVGYVEDLASVFGQVRVTVAPLTYGAGIKGKVLESMAAGIPCVCTPVAAEGLDLPDALQATVADTVAGLAAAIVRLHSDAVFNTECRNAGLAYVRQRLSERRIDELLKAAVFPPGRAIVAAEGRSPDLTPAA